MKVISCQLQRRQADDLVWEQTCTPLLHCWTVTEKNMKLFRWMNSLKRQMALLVYFQVFESSACLMKSQFNYITYVLCSTLFLPLLLFLFFFSFFLLVGWWGRWGDLKNTNCQGYLIKSSSYPTLVPHHC